MTSLHEQAAALAAEYNWPEEAKLILAGQIPDGFGKEVGKSIAVFKRAFPFGRPEPDVDDYHAKRLARLRLLIAKIRVAEKRGS